MSGKNQLTPRTVAILKHIQTATGPGKLGTHRAAVALLMELPREVVSSIFTRLEQHHLIERINNAPHVASDQKLNFKITSAGIAAVKLGPGAASIRETTYHSGTYAKAVQTTPTASNVNPRNVMTQPVYRPPRNDSPRADSDQHFNFKSKGTSA